MSIFFKWKVFFGLAVMLLITGNLIAQKEPLFKKSALDSLGIRCYEMLIGKGQHSFITSSSGFWFLRGHELGGGIVSLASPAVKNFRNFMAEDGIRAMVEGPDSLLFFATHDNLIACQYNFSYVLPPFYFPPKGQPVDQVSALFSDNEGDLYIGTSNDNFYFVKAGASRKSALKVKFNVVDSMLTLTKGEIPVTKIKLVPQVGVFSFAQDGNDKNIIWIGTNHGLYRYNKLTGKSNQIITGNDPAETKCTITHIELSEKYGILFSTLEKGMGLYNDTDNTMEFIPYPKKKSNATTRYPIKTFCYKSEDNYFVAIVDSFPAVYNIKSGTYAFIDDSSLYKSPNSTTDIKLDKAGNLLIIKAGVLYVGNISRNKLFNSAIKIDSTLLAPYISAAYFPDGKYIQPNIIGSSKFYNEIRLKYNQNKFYIYYDLADYGSKDSMEFAWKIEGYTTDWVYQVIRNNDSANVVVIHDMKPGKYVFELKVKVGNEDWRKQQAKMIIIITPPFWQTWWFWTSVIAGLGLLIGLILWWQIRAVKKRERERFTHERQILELEAKALRAQMNPHFIFNCLNSIKSLMQEQQTEKGITYLTTFSKLIRTLFNNADKKEVSLYDEIETCKLYLQLEAMRFDTKFSYAVNVDDTIDLKSIQVPALIIQPFIENAIWHGIVPRNNGGHVLLNVLYKDDAINVVIDDDGIGREASAKNKSASGLAHQSKGVNLTQTRLELNNLLQQRQAELEVIDKKDEDGIATGTTVIIKINEELS